MSRVFIALFIVLSVRMCSCMAQSSEDLYRDEIRGLLAEKCFACHGPDVQEADLRFDTREAAVAKLDSGERAVVPGDFESSELVTRVTSDDPDQRMPPEGDPVSPLQIKQLQMWIKGGAPYVKHWAYTPLDQSKPPRVKTHVWIANPIDRYVLAKLEEQGIAPSPQADRYTLAKRVHYDLIGLPPTPDEVDAFVNDDNPLAYERLVDALLASKHFGERWGRHWLDKARYADSDGYEKDRPRPNAWKFRDWVIDAINDDMPIDQFTVEQLAGDLLPDASPMQRLATAFHRQTLTNTEGGVDQEEFRVEAVFDRTETTGAIWLGLTIGCARCHTHKYDAISQDEYYRLFAFFNNGDESNLKIPQSDAAMEKYRSDKSNHDQQLAELNQQLTDARSGWEVAFESWQTDLAQKLSELEPIALHDLSITDVTASVDGVTFERQDDGSYFVGGENSESPVDYRILATVNTEKPITGIRIDAMKDKRLPKGGPGRVKHGNFVLSELLVNIADQPLKLTGGEASFSQKNWPPANAIDGKLDTGWAVSPKLGQGHHVSFSIDQPNVVDSDQSIAIELRQHYGQQHAIGRFRIRLQTGFGNADELAPKLMRDIVKLAADKRNKKQSQQLVDYFLKTQFAPTKAVYNQIDQLEKGTPTEPLIQVRVINQRANPRETKVFDRGVFLNPTHAVTAGGLGTLPPISARVGDGLDRLDLANWLVGEQNSLTPRVLANHVWSHLFGQGLVRTVNDFGVRGESPTHPQLLDWLAGEYRRLGWSRKKLIKTIVMSSTYQQASHHRPELLEVDAQNRLLARQNRIRVPAEIVRDLCLTVGGLLSDKIGGPSVFPPLPADVAALSYANNLKWKTSQGADRYRRGMYTFFKRTSPHPNLTVFDCPDSNTTNLARRISNTPLQALAVLNNEVYHEAAQGLAARVLKLDCENDHDRVEAMLRLCVTRPPSSFEVERFVRLLESSRSWYSEHVDGAKQMASRHQSEDVPASESAAWIAVTRIALNLDEFVTRE